MLMLMLMLINALPHNLTTTARKGHNATRQIERLQASQVSCQVFLHPSHPEYNNCFCTANLNGQYLHLNLISEVLGTRFKQIKWTDRLRHGLNGQPSF
jgi:hypothetical protein